MRTIKVYRPPGESSAVEGFINSLDEKLRDKLLLQIFRLSVITKCEIKEPHFKHFVLEKYNMLYELREKNKILVRVIFTFCDGDILLLTPFTKRQPRDTMRALEQSIRILAELREHPEHAVEFNFCKEESK